MLSSYKMTLYWKPLNDKIKHALVPFKHDWLLRKVAPRNFQSSKSFFEHVGSISLSRTGWLHFFNHVMAPGAVWILPQFDGEVRERDSKKGNSGFGCMVSHFSQFACRLSYTDISAEAQ